MATKQDVYLHYKLFALCMFHFFHKFICIIKMEYGNATTTKELYKILFSHFRQARTGAGSSKLGRRDSHANSCS